MTQIYTITAKIKINKTVQAWFKDQSKKAAKLYNDCLRLQFERVSCGEKLYSQFDFAAHFRAIELGSDYKDRIFERIAVSTKKWVKSESLRYELYWKDKLTDKVFAQLESSCIAQKYAFLKEVEHCLLRRKEFNDFMRRLARTQKMSGKPRFRKKCSLSFSIRNNRQDTIKILKRTLEIVVPKSKEKFRGAYNFPPKSSDYAFKLATLKEDSCGTLWLKLAVEEKSKRTLPLPVATENKILVGIDMGLKTARTAVAVDEQTKEIIDVFQPQRVRYFDKSYTALVWASNKDRRHLSFVHRKIARRRLDNIYKESKKILSMGDVFKFGKPNSAFLFSGRLARSAADVANSMFLTHFARSAALACKEMGEVNESYTSVTCRKCQSRKHMPLKYRMYECSQCGHTEDRDLNSAYQIAFRDLPGEKKTALPLTKIFTNGELSRRKMKLVPSVLGDF